MMGSVLLTGGMTPAAAHFLELIPSADMVEAGRGQSVTVDMTFTHPLAGGPVMNMAKPVKFGMLARGKNVDLQNALRDRQVDGKSAFRASIPAEIPGDCVVYAQTQPYWEGAEGRWITQYAKVIIDVGQGDGWDKMIGLPVEIEPLVRPYGLWTGNLFRGIVRRDGKPVPHATIEVEWRNDGSVRFGKDGAMAQVIKADGQGQFAYAMPRAGWWGFNAVIEDGRPASSPDGRPATRELGAVLWVRTQDLR